MKRYLKHLVLAAAVLGQMATCAAVVRAEDATVETTADVSASVQANAASTYTGLKKDADGVWRYYTNGVFDNTKTGVVMYGEGWFYVTDGVLDPAFVGLVPYNGGVFYVTAGQVRTEVTGLVISTDGNWYYLSSGQVRTDVTGLVMDTDGQWYYVSSGRVRTDVTGLVQNTDGNWYYLSSGRVRTDYSGRVWYNNNCYIVKYGALDTAANGIIVDEGVQYYASYGQIQLGLTGLVQNVDGRWYYISSGQVRTDYSGLALYNDHWFVIKNGMLDTAFNGLYDYNNEQFLFTDGMMRVDYTGEYTLNGTTYYIVAGQVKSTAPVTRSQQEIRSFLASHPFNLNSRIQYAVEPSLTGNVIGQLSSQSIQDGLNAINCMRYIAGLPANVTTNADMMNKAQSAAFVLAKNNTGLSHNPTNSGNSPADIYNAGYQGASKSNLGSGYWNLSSSVVEGYMDDGGPSNIARVGHRRWILTQGLTETGFGYCGTYTATHVINESTAKNTMDYVLWPAKTMPVNLFYGPWSILLSNSVYSSDLSSVQIRMTNRNTGASWVFNSSTNNNPYNTSQPFYTKDTGGYGKSYALIFTPRVSFKAGDVVAVEVTGLKSRSGSAESIYYEVTFFQP